jgi:peptidoglycan/xylan/chitin deacetylase (PgdA/CDA1 family)
MSAFIIWAAITSTAIYYGVPLGAVVQASNPDPGYEASQSTIEMMTEEKLTLDERLRSYLNVIGVSLYEPPLPANTPVALSAITYTPSPTPRPPTYTPTPTPQPPTYTPMPTSTPTITYTPVPIPSSSPVSEPPDASAEKGQETPSPVPPNTSTTEAPIIEPTESPEPPQPSKPKNHSPKSKNDRPRIALTFDDGPSDLTPTLLDILYEHNAKATFCVVGQRINTYEDYMRAAYEQGHEIIGHSWNHGELTRFSAESIREQIEGTNNAIFDVIGVRPYIYRPPYGAVNQRVRDVSAELGVALINWSIDTLDWKSRNSESVYGIVMNQARDGAVILFHDLYASTIEAARRAVPALIEQGYELATISELFGWSEENPPSPGELYFNAK